jgi:hypothetical protein
MGCSSSVAGQEDYAQPKAAVVKSSDVAAAVRGKSLSVEELTVVPEVANEGRSVQECGISLHWLLAFKQRVQQTVRWECLQQA